MKRPNVNISNTPDPDRDFFPIFFSSCMLILIIVFDTGKKRRIFLNKGEEFG
jgi:hypothetical protein